MQLSSPALMTQFGNLLQGQLFPVIESATGPLSKHGRLLISIVSMVPLGRFTGKRSRTGRPPRDRQSLATAFLAKAVYNLTTTRQLLDRLRSALGVSIVFITHDLRVAAQICDRVAIIHRGSVLDAGTLDELRERHHEKDLEELFFGLMKKEEKLWIEFILFMTKIISNLLDGQMKMIIGIKGEIQAKLDGQFPKDVLSVGLVNIEIS